MSVSTPMSSISLAPIRSNWNVPLHWRAATEPAKDLSTALPAESSRLEPNVLVRRRVRIRGDQGEGRLLYLGSHASNESIFPDRSEHDAIVEDPLDLVE